MKEDAYHFRLCFTMFALKLLISSIFLGFGVGAPAIAHSNVADEPPLGPGCGQCDPAKVWNDVIFMFESTESAASIFNDNLYFLQRFIGWFNVQKSNSTVLQSLRAGILVYSDTVQVVAPLGSIDGNDIMNIVNLPFLGGGINGPNMEGAYKTSFDQFQKYGRPNARHVIFNLAVDVNFGGSYDPQQIVSTFKAKSGISMIYQNNYYGGGANPKLELLASPGYFIMTSDSNIYTEVVFAFCDANCFCDTNWTSFSNSGQRGVPADGCYYPVETPANYAMASMTCNNHMAGSYVATDRSADKSTFLTGLFSSDVLAFYIGLQLNATNDKWQWADGYPLNGDYQPWSSSPPPSDPTRGLCALYSEIAKNWWQLNCRLPNPYVCESAPCSSNQYCPLGSGSDF